MLTYMWQRIWKWEYGSAINLLFIFFYYPSIMMEKNTILVLPWIGVHKKIESSLVFVVAKKYLWCSPLNHLFITCHIWATLKNWHWRVLLAAMPILFLLNKTESEQLCFFLVSQEFSVLWWFKPWDLQAVYRFCVPETCSKEGLSLI